MLNGQTTLIILLIIAVIGSFTVFLSLNVIDPVVITENQEQKTIKNTVENFIRSEVQNTKEIILKGEFSYLDDTVIYNGSNVGYFSDITREKLENEFEERLTESLPIGLFSLERNLGNNSVVFDDFSISVNILDNKIVTEVDMPTEFRNQTISQPYIVETMSSIGRIFDFSTEIVEATQNNDFFQTLTMASILSSPSKNGIQEIPLTIPMFTDCNFKYYRDWYDIKPLMENSITKIIRQTGYGGEEKIKLSEIDANKYDLVVEFDVPDNFQLDKKTFYFTPNPISIEARDVSGICFSNPVNVRYSIKYPVIVIIKDKNRRERRIFALTVMIDENKASTEFQENNDDACSNPKCKANIVVKANGNIISDPGIRFIGCPVEDENIPCASGELVVRSDGFETFKKYLDGSSLDGYIVELEELFTIDLKFYEIAVEKTESGLMISPSGIKVNSNDVSLFIGGSERGFTGPSGTTELTQGSYAISSILFDENGAIGGFSPVSVGITTAKTIYINTPTIKSYETLDAEEKINMLNDLSQVTEHCLGLVTNNKPSLNEECEVLIE